MITGDLEVSNPALIPAKAKTLFSPAETEGYGISLSDPNQFKFSLDFKVLR
jgi:hypothetical protein